MPLSFGRLFLLKLKIALCMLVESREKDFIYYLNEKD